MLQQMAHESKYKEIYDAYYNTDRSGHYTVGEIFRAVMIMFAPPTICIRNVTADPDEIWPLQR